MKYFILLLRLLLLPCMMQASAVRTDTLPPAAILNELALTPEQKAALKELLTDYRNQQAAGQRQLRNAVMALLTRNQRRRLAQLLQQWRLRRRRF